MSGEANVSKVLFRTDDGEVETLWAKSVGPNEYQLDNSPFYAYGVSWQDIVFAPPDATEGMPTFRSVVRKSGHRTVRVILDPPYEAGNPSAAEMDTLVALGCSFEGSHHKLMSVDIPPAVDLQLIRQHLIERNLQWEHADPTYEELFLNDAQP